MNDNVPTHRLFALSANTNIRTLLFEAERLTTAEEALEITTANLKEDGTFCDDFKEDLLWLISVKDKPIKMRQLEWHIRIEEYWDKVSYSQDDDNKDEENPIE